MTGTRPVLAGALIACVLGAAPAALASGTPYYGFSGYYGGPATYYTHDTDVHQTTQLEGGSETFGTRVYTAGGPFWRFHPNARHSYGPRHRKARYVRVKG